jgi:hypothetical protein
MDPDQSDAAGRGNVKMNEVTYQQHTAEVESVVYDYEPMQAGPQAATKWQFLWLCGLILSFCYEIAIVQLTTLDRVNPRLFDVAFLIGVCTVLPGLKTTNPLPRIFKRWAAIVAVFAVCALIWTVWLPVREIGFSLFYLVKYLEGLLAVYMVARIPLTAHQKKIIHSLVIVGGIVVAIYAIPQYLRGGVSRVLVEQADKEVHRYEGQFFSCLAASYFHVAFFSVLSSVMAFAFFLSAKRYVTKFISLGLGLFISWPAFFSGARVGIAACLVAWTVFFLFSKVSFKVIAIIFVIGLLMLTVASAPKILSYEKLVEKSSALQRLHGKEEGEGGGIADRLVFVFSYMNAYNWQGWRLPFIGAGFYVAPVRQEDGSLFFRHAYGIHNTYAFAFEQGGIAVFVLFIIFLLQCWKALNRSRRFDVIEDSAFATGIFAFFVTALGAGLVNVPPFWLTGSTQNFHFYWVALLIIAVRSSISDWTDNFEQIEYQSEWQQ